MKHKILIIDDEEMILEMLKKCLEAEDFLVYTANSAKRHWNSCPLSQILYY